MYKIRIYYTTGTKKGNLKEERFFDTLEDVTLFYNSIFQYNLYGLNPTVWKLKNNDWIRLAGY